VPILSLQRSVELAKTWTKQGFDILKLKVGGEMTGDLERVRCIAAACPRVSFLLDANQGFTAEEAVTFMQELGPVAERVIIFEQPVARDDLDGMVHVRERVRVPISADETVATVADARRVIETGAADIINLKITKSGLLETMDIITVARAAGVKLTIGGMVETRLAMGCSLALVMGLGGIDLLDLDTPLLMARDPLSGGYGYDGPLMTVWHDPGLGMRPTEVP
jgi:L-alanine-DL-glutamate epimerase-like enolase superfamily enzyme